MSFQEKLTIWKGELAERKITFNWLEIGLSDQKLNLISD